MVPVHVLKRGSLRALFQPIKARDGKSMACRAAHMDCESAVAALG